MDAARTEVNNALATLPTHTQNARDFCTAECGKIRDVRSMIGAANAYRKVNFSDITSLIDALVAGQPDWESPAKDMYTNRRLVAQSKTRNSASAIRDIIKVFDDLDDATNSYFLGAILLVGGIIAAVAGIIMAIPTGGWGLVVAIIGGLITLAGWFTLPDMSGTLADAQTKFSALTDDIQSVSWGKPTTDAAWTW